MKKVLFLSITIFCFVLSTVKAELIFSEPKVIFNCQGPDDVCSSVNPGLSSRFVYIDWETRNGLQYTSHYFQYNIDTGEITNRSYWPYLEGHGWCSYDRCLHTSLDGHILMLYDEKTDTDYTVFTATSNLQFTSIQFLDNKILFKVRPSYSEQLGTVYFMTFNDTEAQPTVEERVGLLESMMTTVQNDITTIQSKIADILTEITNIWNKLNNHETRISTLEQITTTSITTTTASTTTTVPSNIEERLSIIEKMICQIKYIDGFCPPKCPRPYSCSNTCEDNTKRPLCYDRTIHPEYYCSSDRVCCESVKVSCST